MTKEIAAKTFFHPKSGLTMRLSGPVIALLYNGVCGKELTWDVTKQNSVVQKMQEKVNGLEVIAGKGEQIVTEGEQGDIFFILEKGEAQALKKD